MAINRGFRTERTTSVTNRMTHQRLLSAVLFAVVFLGGMLSPSAANAATYYVGPTGNDSQAGTSSAPFRTLLHAVSVLKAGDTLIIREGTYREGYGTIIPPSGTGWSAPVTIRGQGTVILQPNPFRLKEPSRPVKYVVFDHLIFDDARTGDGINISQGSGYIRFQNYELRYTKGSGIVVGEASIGHNEFLDGHVHHIGTTTYHHGFYIFGSHNLVAGNTIHNVQSGGIKFGQAERPQTGNIARNNRIYNFAEGTAPDPSGFGIASALNNNNSLVYNNVIYNCGGESGGNPSAGLYNWKGDNNAFYHNTIYNMGPNCNSLYLSATITNAKVRNNIFLSGNPVVYDDLTTNSDVDTNLCSAAGTGCAIVGDPKFVDPQARDFHLQKGSPAIDKGVKVGAVTQDFDGVSRPQGAAHDIGAYEYRASGAPTYTLKTSKSAYTPGEAISVSWTVSPGSGNLKDWIGFYLASETDNSKYIPTDGAGNEAWTYTEGQDSGVFTIIAPSASGTYEFRYLLNEGYTHLATSPKVSITMSSVLLPPANFRRIP